MSARVRPSPWLLLVVMPTALYVVAGKRYSELMSLGPGWARARGMAEGYTAASIRQICAVARAVAVIGYGLWTLAAATGDGHLTRLSFLPFAVALFRYGVLLKDGRGDALVTWLLRLLPRPVFCRLPF